MSAGTPAVAVISAIIAAAGVVLATGGDQRAETSAAQPVAELPIPFLERDSSLERATAEAGPSVVELETKAGRLSSEGSGIVLTPDGLILTSSHVVSGLGGSRGATFADGRTAAFSVVATDPVTDVAFVRAQGISGLTPITIGSSAGPTPTPPAVPASHR